MGTRSEDLFKEFNEDKAGKVCGKREAGKVLVLGPLRSGKTFFINNYLKPHIEVEEYPVGLVGKKPRQRGGKAVDFLKRVMPWIKDITDHVSIDAELSGFSSEVVEEFKKLLGDKAPKYIIQDIVNKANEVNASSITAYYIPWGYKEITDEKAREALDLIVEAFNSHKTRVRWLKAEYIPPGLVKEVTELIESRGREKAREVVGEWVDAYVTVLSILGLHEKVEWDSSFINSVSDFIKNLSGNFIAIVSYITGSISLGSLASFLILLITNHIFKIPQRGGASDVINLIASLNKLKALKPSNEVCGEFNELGKIVTYKLAASLNLDADEVCKALIEITSAKEEELRGMIEDVSRRITEVEERIENLEKRVESFKQEVKAGITTANRGEFEKGHLYPNIEVEDDELKIRVNNEYYNVVETGKFGSTINNVINELRQSKIIVLTGPRGIGKSVLAASVIWKLLDSGEIGLVARVDQLNEYNDSEFKTFIKNYLMEFKKVFGKLLILYDPSSTKIYEKERERQPIPEDINETIKNLLGIIDSKFAEDSMILIILPSDIYSSLNEYAKKSLEQRRIEVELSDIKFLSEVIRNYSGRCKSELSENILTELAIEVAKFGEGYTLIARLIGMELAKSGCNIHDVKRIIEESEYKADIFIAGFINAWLDVVDEKGQVKLKRAEILAEILAIRRPFAKLFNPGTPILIRGIIRVIEESNSPEVSMNDEMVDWLIIKQHDLVENTIEKLLDGEDLGGASKPWRSIKVPKITNSTEAAKYFINNYGEKFSKKLSRFSNCWKRGAVIIGYALTGHLIILPDERDLPSDIKVVDALNSCDIDYYLLVGNKIPPTLFIFYTHGLVNSLLSVFANEYENAINEIKNLLETWRRRDAFCILEVLYALGLTLIVAEAARLGKNVNEDDASIALKAAAYAVQSVAFSICVEDILMALRFLVDKAPQQYLVVLAEASAIGTLDVDTVEFIYVESGYIFSKYFDRLKKLVWPLVITMEVYSQLFLRPLRRFIKKRVVEGIVEVMYYLLSILKGENSELATIAEAWILLPALLHAPDVENFMIKYQYVDDLVTRAIGVLKNLKELANKSGELVKKEYFMSYTETRTLNVTEESVRKVITELEGYLTFALAEYRLDNGELNEALKLFNEAAEIGKNIENWDLHIDSRNRALRVEVVKAGSINEYVNVASDLEKLWYEVLKHFKYVAQYLETATVFLGDYLVYLASISRYDNIEKTLSEYGFILNYREDVSILTRLMLRLLGFAKEVAEIKPEELIEFFGANNGIHNELLPTLKLALGIKASVEECESAKGLDERLKCIIDAFSAVRGNSYALEELKKSLKELLEIAQGLDGKELIQLLAPKNSTSQLAFMLYALVNGNVELAKKHAHWGSKSFPGLCSKLFRDAYESCCDISSERFKLTLLKLYHLHF